MPSSRPRSCAVPSSEIEEALAILEPRCCRRCEPRWPTCGQVARRSFASTVAVELEQGQRVEVTEMPVRAPRRTCPAGARRTRRPWSCARCPRGGRRGARSPSARPPGPGGRAHPVILAACALCGVNEVYRMGGAQAIAALAYGTETVRPVDVIVGPGNAYVTEAKRQVVGVSGSTASTARASSSSWQPTDADPELVALDLLAQAEHGDGQPARRALAGRRAARRGRDGGRAAPPSARA